MCRPPRLTDQVVPVDQVRSVAPGQAAVPSRDHRTALRWDTALVALAYRARSSSSTVVRSPSQPAAARWRRGSGRSRQASPSATGRPGPRHRRISRSGAGRRVRPRRAPAVVVGGEEGGLVGGDDDVRVPAAAGRASGCSRYCRQIPTSASSGSGRGAGVPGDQRERRRSRRASPRPRTRRQPVDHAGGLRGRAPGSARAVEAAQRGGVAASVQACRSGHHRPDGPGVRGAGHLQDSARSGPPPRSGLAAVPAGRAGVDPVGDHLRVPGADLPGGQRRRGARQQPAVQTRRCAPPGRLHRRESHPRPQPRPRAQRPVAHERPARIHLTHRRQQHRVQPCLLARAQRSPVT